MKLAITNAKSFNKLHEYLSEYFIILRKKKIIKTKKNYKKREKSESKHNRKSHIDKTRIEKEIKRRDCEMEDCRILYLFLLRKLKKTTDTTLIPIRTDRICTSRRGREEVKGWIDR